MRYLNEKELNFVKKVSSLEGQNCVVYLGTIDKDETIEVLYFLKKDKFSNERKLTIKNSEVAFRLKNLN